MTTLEVWWASAGHLAPLLLGPDPRHLPTVLGIPLGVDPDAVFEVSTTGDGTLDLIEPSTGRILASSDDAPNGVAGGGPGSARCAFEMLEPESVATEWTLAVRGFWPDAQFDYEVRYAVEPVSVLTPAEAAAAVISSVLDTVDIAPRLQELGAMFTSEGLRCLAIWYDSEQQFNEVLKTATAMTMTMSSAPEKSR